VGPGARGRRRLRRSLRLGLAVLLALVPAPAAAATADGPGLVTGMEAAWARVSAYTARFLRQEVVGGVLRPAEEARLKYQRPGRIYLRWLAGPPAGRQILFVPGRDGDRALVHEPGLPARLFTVLLAPDSPRVLRESRHPITDIGLGRLVELIAGDVRRAQGRGDLSASDEGVRREAAGTVRRVVLVLAGGVGAGYHAARVVVDVAVDHGLPVEVALHDAGGERLAWYAYRDLVLDAALTEEDFDPDNPAYGFPRWRVAL
jgi:hypothetical protein